MSSAVATISDEKKQLEAAYEGTEEGSYEEWLDLEASFTKKERASLTRKLDLCILVLLTYFYLLAWIDRGNAGNAKIYGLVEDTGMTGSQFNLCLMIFFFTYAAIMVPSQYLIKLTSPQFMFPTMMLTFGIVTIGTGFIQNFGEFLACRLILGLCEGGYYPGQVFVISVWYSKKQIQKRIAVFYAISALAGGFAGFIAYGVGNLEGELGHRSWRYLYWTEGAITCFSGLIGYFITATWPQKSKIVSEKERKYIILRQRYSAGKVAPKDTNIRKKDIMDALKDIKVWCMLSVFFGSATTQNGIAYILPTIVKSLGYTSQKAQGLTAPPYVFAAIVVFVSSVWADKKQERMIVIIWSAVCNIIGIIIVWASLYHPNLYGLTYFGCFLALAGSYTATAPMAAFLATNLAPIAKRGAGIAIMSCIGTLGGAVGANIFLPSEAPTYPTGFGISTAFLVVFILLPSIYMRYYCVSKNREREQMSEDEVRAKYTENELSEMGDSSPLFRFTK